MVRCFLVGWVLLAGCARQQNEAAFVYEQGAIVRGDTATASLSLVFTAHEFGDGADHIFRVLDGRGVHASFFFTGDFYRNSDYATHIARLVSAGHYLGAHSDRHLLYCDWDDRDRLLVTRQQFVRDLDDNYLAMAKHGISKEMAPFFLPPYEWYNDSISRWTEEEGLTLINMSRGTRSHADYTTPDMPAYIGSDAIFGSIRDYEARSPSGLNGFILLIHYGTDPARTDKFYLQLDVLIQWLEQEGYQLLRIDDLLTH